MGNPTVHKIGTQPEIAQYKILKYRGIEVPSNYHAAILSKFLRTLRYGNDLYRLIAPEFYWDTLSNRLKSIVGNPTCSVALAVLADETDVLLGFLIHRAHVLDYAWVTNHCRRNGIMRSMMPNDIQIYTHVTKHFLPVLATERFKKTKFNPFI